MIITRAILIITILANLFILFVLIKANYKRKINQILIIQTIGIIGWALFILLNIWMPDFTGRWEYAPGDLGYLFEKFIFVSATIGLITAYWFIYFFFQKKFISSFLNYLLIAYQFFNIALCLAGNFLFSKIAIQSQGYSLLTRQPLNIVYSIFVFLHLILPFTILITEFIKSTKSDQAIYKKQTKILFFSYLIFFILAFAFNWFLPIFFGIFSFNAFGPTLSLILVITFSYSINRYQFLNIRSVIQKSLIYTFSLSAIIGFYLLILFIFGYFFQQTTRVTILFSAGLTTILGIYSAPTIGRYFSRLTDKIFFKDKYDYSEAINRLSETLNKNIGLEMLLSQVHNDLKSILKCSDIKIVIIKQNLIFNNSLKFVTNPEPIPNSLLKSIAIANEPVLAISNIPNILKTNKKPANITLENYHQALEMASLLGKKHNIDIFVGIIMDNELVGLMMLGPKLSGDYYTPEDLNLLETFSYQAAVAIEKSQLYEQVKKYSQELESKVRRRTAKIKRMQEEQKQMMLDISHGLKTPLTVLKGELEFLQRKSPDDEQLKVFEKSTDRITKFIHDMLALAKLEGDSTKIKNEPVNFSLLINELIEYFKVLAQDKKIDIKDKIAPDIFVTGDADKLDELVTSLVSNAIKYIGQGNKISIELTANAELTILDNGIGISQKDLSHIFSRFYRVKNGTGEKGSGLGLAICKKIVDLHKGKIRAESTLGKGSKFIVNFPVKI